MISKPCPDHKLVRKAANLVLALSMAIVFSGVASAAEISRHFEVSRPESISQDQQITFDIELQKDGKRDKKANHKILVQFMQIQPQQHRVQLRKGRVSVSTSFDKAGPWLMYIKMAENEQDKEITHSESFNVKRASRKGAER